MGNFTRFFILFLLPVLLSAAEPSAQTGAQEVDIQKLKKEYWAKGKDTEIGLVQNRLYSKKHRIELGATGGFLSGDPFLSMHNFGGTVGYHFSEYLSAHAIGWVTSVSSSSALSTLQTQTGTTANTNAPNNYFGVEGRASLLYGKLSLTGSTIIYFDSYFSMGGGRIGTESGGNLLASAGLGQQIHISKYLAINLDFKLLYYQETILGKGIANAGTDLGRHTNLSDSVNLGVSYFFDSIDGDGN